MTGRRLQTYVIGPDHEVRPASMEEWARQFGLERHVADQRFGHEGIGEIRISTVFLGLDHRNFGDGPPLVFETMIFGGGDELDGYTARSSTWAEALVEHRKAVELVKNAFSELAKASGA